MSDLDRLIAQNKVLRHMVHVLLGLVMLLMFALAGVCVWSAHNEARILAALE